MAIGRHVLPVRAQAVMFTAGQACGANLSLSFGVNFASITFPPSSAVGNNTTSVTAQEKS
ncbi:hypothetical protein HOK021_26840 [Streptomyces hygroscopicus]|nr:hypothetical protein HOK021_26840 [Streptomyces hygroscopicus]